LRTLLCSVAAAVVLLATLPAQSMAVIDPPGHIDNGTVQLGVKTDGALNVYNIDDFGDFFGLRYLPTGNEATSAAEHACEGWGVADISSGASGYSNFGCDDGSPNIRVVSYTKTATTAVSTVLVCANDADPLACNSGDSPLLRVTHDYHPSARTPNLYEATVTIENVGAATVQPRYRRVVDWQIEPNKSAEALTMSGSTPYILRMSNDGYSSANPLTEAWGRCGSHDPPDEPCVDPYMPISGAGTFSVGLSPPDDPPTDQGSLFDLALPSLAPGGSVEFPLFYGAAGSLDLAKAARDAVDADTYALVTPEDQPTTGTPNTFILGFRLRGVTVTNPPPPPPPPPPPTTTTTTTTTTQQRTVQKKTPVVRTKPLRFEVVKHRYRRKAIEITLLCSADCDVSAKGIIRMLGSSKNFKLKKYKKKLEAGAKTKLKLRLTKSSKRALRRAHAKRAKLFARLSLRVVDGNGQRVSRKPAFKL
jgi:hypothetical protein